MQCVIVNGSFYYKNISLGLEKEGIIDNFLILIVVLW
jgi:hypothetical protein